MLNQNNDIDTFFIPHPQAKQVDAQDVLYALVNQSLDLSNAIALLFDFNENGHLVRIADDELLFNLVNQITNSLKLAKHAMPQALGFTSDTWSK